MTVLTMAERLENLAHVLVNPSKKATLKEAMPTKEWRSTVNAAEYARQVSEVFVLPETCLKIKEIIDSHVSDIDEIAELIQFDPVLSSRLLKLANSALYSFPQQVDSVEKAVLLLGENQVYNLVVAYGAAEAFGSIDSGLIDLEVFWEQSIYCALIAKFLGTALDVRPQEPLYLAGLLHNLGELVVLSVEPDKLIAANQLHKGETPWQRQRHVLGFTYTQCTVELMRCWQLPDSLSRPLRFISNDDASKGTVTQRILHVAAALACAVTKPNQFQLDELINQDVRHALNITDDQLAEAKEFAFVAGVAIMAVFNEAAVTTL